MNAGQVLRANETQALKDNQFVSNVTGKKYEIKNSKGLKSFGTIGFLTASIAIAAILFGSGNLIPAALSERLIEATDVQYADAVESKKIVFEQALLNGEIPEDTASLLKKSGVLVGYVDNDSFIETTSHAGGLSLAVDGKVIKANDFINEVSSNAKLYNAFTRATYGRAAYYYDESAKKVLNEIRSNRKNEDPGNDISINSVSLVRKTRINEKTKEEEYYYVYEENGQNAGSDKSAESLVEQVKLKNPAATVDEATLNAADTLKVADTISKEQRSSVFYLDFMESVSQMKAGEGSESDLNDKMNYLYERKTTEVVDVNTGEKISLSGSAMDSPSLYAIMSGKKVEKGEVENFSSDRILKTIENKTGQGGEKAISGTIASSENGIKGSIGRFIDNSSFAADDSVLDIVTPVVDESLIKNAYDSIEGINAGEMLVEGAVNVGKSLAKASGATAGDASAAINYARLNNAVLAMDAKVDRMNRSPLDITSKNTFLGSIVYKMAILTKGKSGTLLSQIGTFSNLVSSSAISLLPASFADAEESFLNSFGDCETYAHIGAVGTVHCSERAVFDTSTLNDPFNDEGFLRFVEANTSMDNSGTRTINQDSTLAKFIIYNNERTTPLGVVDGGILDSLSKNSSSVFFSNNIFNMVLNSLGSSETNKKIATGEAFVNSSNNDDWETYKYAQRYVSLARATAALKRFTNDPTAYNNIKYFEGETNPVIAFLNDYLAKK